MKNLLESNYTVVERSWFRYLILAVFAITGATGLIYQVLWVRLLVLSFGYTIYSVSIVVTAFMGGLAIGSVIGGTLADRLRSPVLAYGLSEIGVGLIALATYPLLKGLPEMIAGFRGFLELPYYGFSPWTLLVSLAILLPPTILMGFTLPLLARAMTRTSDSASFDIGNLYSVNTIGAAAGCILTGFILIAVLGVYKTLVTAASLNIIIGVIAVVLSRRVSSGPAETLNARVVKSKDPSAPSLISQPVFWAFGVSGFAALAGEVMWIRVFSPYLENSTYAFSLILGIFLFGIASGGWAGRKAASRVSSSSAGFGICQVLVSITTGVGLLSIFIYIQRYYSMLPLHGMLVHKPSMILEQSFGIVLILLPSTFFMGAGFPFIARWAAEAFERLGTRTGRLYAANTVGSVLGSIGAGFVLMPMLGIRDSLIFLTFLFFLNGFMLIWLNRKELSFSHRPLVFLGLLLAAFIITLRLNPDPNIFALESAYRDYKITAYREDPDVNVAVLDERGENPGVRFLNINLKPVSGSRLSLTPWMAHLPLMLHSHTSPSRMLVIGLGIGHTFTSALTHPGLKVDVVELVPSVAELFSELNPSAEAAISSQRSRIIVGDGRNYLLSTRETYDVIAIDPTPPLYGTGAVNLYTSDFFEIVKKKLSPDGILMLRVHASTDYRSLRLLIRTATEMFPHVSLWQPPGKSGFSLIASTGDYRAESIDLTEKVKGTSFLSDDWKEVLLVTKPVLVGEGSVLVEFVENIPVVTDDRPHLEFPLFH